MNVEIGTVAVQFLFWEYLVQIFDIGSLQCTYLSSRSSCLLYFFSYVRSQCLKVALEDLLGTTGQQRRQLLSSFHLNYSE